MNVPRRPVRYPIFLTCELPRIVSSLVLAVLYCFDTSVANPTGGNFPVSLLIGIVATLVLAMPPYGMATLFRTLLKWPEWTRIVIVGVLWAAFFYLIGYHREGSGIQSLADLCSITFQFWFVTLAYGVPAVITNYWVNSRRVAVDQELLRLEASARPPHNPDNF